MKKTILLILALALFVAVNGQQKKRSSKTTDYSTAPLWIKMMDDSNANFHTVEYAYTTYWKYHKKPEGEHDVIGEYEAHEKNPDRFEKKDINADNKMRMALKKYEWWHRNMQPYVQTDGHILYPSERLKIWREQQEIQKQNTLHK